MLSASTARCLFGTALALGYPLLGFAQDPYANPLNGELRLRGMIVPDPYVLQFNVSGNYAVPGTLGSASCAGNITSSAPDIKFVIESGIPAHGVVVRSDTDTTLIVNSPDNLWFCSDDDAAAGGSNPGLDFNNSPPGTYSIWVGTYSAGSSATVTLSFTQQSSSTWSSLSNYPVSGVPAIGIPRNNTVYLGSPVSPDPYTMTVHAGGASLINDLGQGCFGYIAPSRPDAVLDFSGSGYLGIFAEAPVDTTLAINAPDGSWHCNDDSGYLAGGNPGVEFTYAPYGTYQIWLGTYSENNNADATLVFTQAATDCWMTLIQDSLVPPVPDPTPVPEVVPETVTPIPGRGRDAEVELAARFGLDPHVVAITAGGDSQVADLGATCLGFLDPAQPDVRLNFTNGGVNLGIFAVDSVDSTLVVNTPSGEWYCNDDSPNLAGNDPSVLIENAASGYYHIWLAGYSSADRGDARLVFTQLPAERWATLNIGDPVPLVLGVNAVSLEIDEVDVSP